MRASFIGVAVGCVCLFVFIAVGHAERPNFLVIVVDDQSPFDLQRYNSRSPLDTPHIDRLAREGVTLDAAYHMGSWSGAVCTASRHMIMSGRTLWHIPVRGQRPLNPNIDDPLLVPPDLADYSLPEVFNRAGYDTMRTCKTGNSYDAANKRFAVSHVAMKRGGTAETGSAWHAERVLEFLADRKRRSDEDPFLVYFGFSHPHDVRNGTPELLAKYGAVNHTDRETLPPAHVSQPPLPVNYLAAHPFPHGHPQLRDEVAVPGVWRRRDPRTIRNEIGRQFACSENIDTQIGRVLSQLDADGDLDNTVVVYTSDHGMAIGRHGLQGKQNLYEHTWRVPMLIRGPGIPANVRAPGNVYLLDLLATLCDLAGIEPPATNEGTSFVPVLRGEHEIIRDVLYGAYCGGTKPGIRSIRRGDWKLIKYDVLDGAVRETQLFHLAQNPHEFVHEHAAEEVVALTGLRPSAIQRNLADDPRFADQRRELEALLESEQLRLNDPYVLAPAIAP